MNLLSPPTDNLYKFMAIAGLTLMVLSGVGPLRILHDVRTQASQLKTEEDVLKQELNALLHAHPKPDPDVNGLQSKVEAWAISARDKYQGASADLMDRLTQIGRAEEAAKLARLDGTSEAAEAANTDANVLTRFAYAGLLGGGALAFGGFVLWYYKVQRYLDEQLMRAVRRESGDQTIGPSNSAPAARSGK